jgi:hypothetical protein
MVFCSQLCCAAQIKQQLTETEIGLELSLELINDNSNISLEEQTKHIVQLLRHPKLIKIAIKGFYEATESPSHQALITILNALQHSEKLTMLELFGNNLDTDGAKAIAETLQTKKISLRTLYIDFNNISDDGTKFIADALQKNTTLGLILIDSTFETQQAIVTIRNALNKRDTPRWLAVETTDDVVSLSNSSAIDVGIITLRYNGPDDSQPNVFGPIIERDKSILTLQSNLENKSFNFIDEILEKKIVLDLWPIIKEYTKPYCFTKEKLLSMIMNNTIEDEMGDVLTSKDHQLITTIRDSQNKIDGLLQQANCVLITHIPLDRHMTISQCNDLAAKLRQESHHCKRT